MKFQDDNNKVILCILDGFALGDQSDATNPVQKNNIPNFSKLLEKYPNTELFASGNAVGLDNGQMGNSEVGHMIIGSGIVPIQDLPMINTEISTGEIFKNKSIQNAIDFAKKHKSKVHIIGMYSDGGVHSHKNHIESLANIFDSNGIGINLHIITDGRDVDLDKFKTNDHKNLENFVKSTKNTTISTISGRYYAMDRDNRWDRTKLYLDTVLFAKGRRIAGVEDILTEAESDEFVIPAVIGGDYQGVNENDIIIFANFRSDRMKQIVKVCTGYEKIYDDLPNMQIFCMMEYYEDLRKKAGIIFEKSSPDTCLSEIVSKSGKKQLKIAETEKYPHVTFFFNGNIEKPFDGEDRILINSPTDIKTYDEKPEMSLPELEKKLFLAIDGNGYDLIVANIANGDMVGHAGNFNASVKAVKHIDDFIGRLYKKAVENDYVLIITADHGNIEESQTKEGKPSTQHTLNKVPFVVINCNKSFEFQENASLSSITLTILDIMGLEKQLI